MAEHAQPSRTGQRECLFGVCAAIGEDFGFNPDILRVPLAAMLLWNPLVLAATYAAAGLLVLLGRWLFPKPEATPDAVATPATVRRPEPEPFREAA